MKRLRILVLMHADLVPPATLEIAGRHHFDVIHELADASSKLHKSVRARMGI